MKHTTINGDSSVKNDCDRQKNFTEQLLNLGIFSAEKKTEDKLILLTSFPEHFDVREKFGKLCPRISRVYNQGQCKSGWVGNLCLYEYLG